MRMFPKVGLFPQKAGLLPEKVGFFSPPGGQRPGLGLVPPADGQPSGPDGGIVRQPPERLRKFKIVPKYQTSYWERFGYQSIPYKALHGVGNFAPYGSNTSYAQKFIGYLKNADEEFLRKQARRVAAMEIEEKGYDFTAKMGRDKLISTILNNIAFMSPSSGT